jgi:hypothetical protein
MAMKAASTARAPRGTKTLTQAFFSAADEIPEAQRDGVIKAAIAAIRDQLKDSRDKAKAAKAKARDRAAKAAPVRRTAARKPAPVAAPPMPARKAKSKTVAKPAAEAPDDGGMV